MNDWRSILIWTFACCLIAFIIIYIKELRFGETSTRDRMRNKAFLIWLFAGILTGIVWTILILSYNPFSIDLIVFDILIPVLMFMMIGSLIGLVIKKRSSVWICGVIGILYGMSSFFAMVFLPSMPAFFTFIAMSDFFEGGGIKDTGLAFLNIILWGLIGMLIGAGINKLKRKELTEAK